MGITSNKDLNELAREAQRQGWLVKQANSSHLKWFPPKGRPVTTSLTPSDRYAINNIERDLVRAGLHLAYYDKPEVKDMAAAKKQKIYGRGERAVEVLHEHAPQPLNLDELSMRVSVRYPGTKASMLMLGLKKALAAGEIVKVARGMYRSAQRTPTPADDAGTMGAVEERQLATVTQLPKPFVDIPASDQEILDRFLSAWADLEKLAQRTQLKIQKLEELKRMLNNQDIL